MTRPLCFLTGCFAIAVAPILVGPTAYAQDERPTRTEASELRAEDIEQAVDAQMLTDLGDLALETAAARQGLDVADLTIANAAVARYPLQGVTGFAYKIMNRTDGSMRSMLIDESGNELDAGQLEEDKAATHEATFGKLHPDLAAALPTIHQDETTPVIIWMKAPDFVGTERHDPETQLSKKEVDALAVAVDRARKELVRPIIAPLAASLADLGYKVSADEYAPVVYAELDPQTILEVSELSDVDMVYPDDVCVPSLNTARRAIKAHTVHSRGITGNGVRVGVIEAEGGRIHTDNPYLSGVVQNWSDWCVSDHGTAVVGIIRSTHGRQRGIAPECRLWVGGSCVGLASTLESRASAAADWGARVINNSWNNDSGSRVPNATARFFDDMVRNGYRTVVVSAGNRGNDDKVVPNPAIAYNVIAVGNFNDRGTIDTSDDSMHSSSSYKDPESTYGDREKPEIAAPGTNITTTSGSSPWVADMGIGTSYSAPMVSGTAALLMQRESALTTWPEAVKAILMATAVNNIEGAERLSDKDGAGGLRADLADDVARRIDGHNWGATSYDCSKPAYWDWQDIYLTAGKRLRVVIVWDTNTDYSSYADRPSADLDLQIISTSGDVVASSSGWDNTYEIVDFTPSSSGPYKLRVNRYRCSKSPGWLAFAWYRFP
ncbi:MAG: S8 family peptidase [Phycisphaerae bacterium]|nr:S8 family peptidase [Phycisphaerae bacterium]